MLKHYLLNPCCAGPSPATYPATQLTSHAIVGWSERQTGLRPKAHHNGVYEDERSVRSGRLLVRAQMIEPSAKRVPITNGLGFRQGCFGAPRRGSRTPSGQNVSRKPTFVAARSRMPLRV